MTAGDVTDAPDLTTCPGCGARTPRTSGPPAGVEGASAGCWQRYGELLARSYNTEAYRAVHQLIVDAYAAQHPTGRTRQQIQKLALCLMTLGLFIENGTDPRHGPSLHQRMMANRPDFHWLRPPPLRGLRTAIDVLAAATPEEHQRLAWDWGRDVWQAWAPHHPTIRRWNQVAVQRGLRNAFWRSEPGRVE